MPADFYKEKEHAFITIGKDIKEGNIPRLVLLCGKEDYLIRFYADALIKKYVSDACRPIDLVTLEGEFLTVDKVKESLETVSLVSERKVVFLPEFTPAAGKAVKGLSDSDIKELIEYFPMIPEGALLLITASEIDEAKAKKNKVRTAVEKHGSVYDFQALNESQLQNFIEKRFRTAGKMYAPSVIRMIVSESGYGNKAIDYSLYNLENDLKKIIAHSDGQITPEDVKEVLASNPENNVFAMLDAIGRNRKDEAFRLLHNLLQSGTPVFNLLRLITGQLELILAVKEMRDEGLSLPQMQKTLGIHQFRIKKAMAVTGQYSMKDLRAALSAAYEVDENIKTGLMDGQLALEYFIAGI
ncbi:MAG: DNA polymerase III subunit delta [Bacillota bacterium]|nr:DNA polymerase III subunit delta [Bacillota bacterium]